MISDHNLYQCVFFQKMKPTYKKMGQEKIYSLIKQYPVNSTKTKETWE